MPRVVLLIALLAVCAACGGGASGESDRLAAVCAATSNLSASICACVAAEAETTLAPNARRMLLAMLEKDEAALEAVRREASLPEATAAATFMVRTPALCASRERDGR